MIAATEGLPTWCEVDLGALHGNVVALRRVLTPGTHLGVVVKSDAYGHGLLPCARAFVGAGARWLIVNSVAEAERLRGEDFTTKVLICGPVMPDLAAAVVATDARVVVYEPGLARALSAAAQGAGRDARVHLKVETGTYRQGVAVDDVTEFATWLKGLPRIVLEGLCTHLADVEDSDDHAFAQQQLGVLGEARKRLAARGIGVQVSHSASSAAALLLPDSHADLVRVGIAAYGLWPSSHIERLAVERGVGVALRPALAWRARLAQVKDVPAGASVGYGRTYHVGGRSGPRRLAVLPVGYYEGLDRRRSNRGHVLVGGIRAPVRGRVCMNMTMAEVTGIEQAKVGDTATLIGRTGGGQITAAEAGEWSDTIHYEVVSRIHPDVPRIHTTREPQEDDG